MTTARQLVYSLTVQAEELSMGMGKSCTLILRILHIWQPREGLPPYTMVAVHPISIFG